MSLAILTAKELGDFCKRHGVPPIRTATVDGGEVNFWMVDSKCGPYLIHAKSGRKELYEVRSTLKEAHLYCPSYWIKQLREGKG